MPERPSLVLVVSIDVEEEGLFCDSYQQQAVTVENTASLTKLRPLMNEGVKPTLFCAHSVLANDRACEHLLALRASAPLEIAAHLHYWNTPPLVGDATHPLKSVPTKNLPLSLLREKLASVLNATAALTGTRATSFRMGRWDIHAHHFPLLAQAGILTDASVRPLHGNRGPSAAQPDHFAAPSTPYWIPTRAGSLFEVPLTVTPLFSVLRPLLLNAPRSIAPLAAYLKSTMNYWGALALLPVYHPLWFMQLVAQLAILRGYPLLSLTWHSSEMHPGATPHLPTERHVTALMTKVLTFVRWLCQRAEVTFATMGETRTLLGSTAPICTEQYGDWTHS